MPNLVKNMFSIGEVLLFGEKVQAIACFSLFCIDSICVLFHFFIVIDRTMKNPYNSPFKKKVSSKISTKSRTEAGNDLVSIGFPPTTIELYSFSKSASGNTKENYTYHYRMHTDGNDEKFHVPVLEEAGFIGYNYMRLDRSSNQRKNGSDGYPRYWLIRCLPEGNPTTSETRLEGLSILNSFFKNKSYSKYPPSHIRTSDLTSDPPKALDNFLLDDDIIGLLEHTFTEDALNPNFARNFPEIASIVYGGPTYSTKAKEELGYGEPNPKSGESGSYVPGFFLPEKEETEQGAGIAEETEKTEENKGDVDAQDEDETEESKSDNHTESNETQDLKTRKTREANKKAELKNKKQRTK